MSQLQIRKNDGYASLRAILHSVGARECRARDFFARGTGSIGIHRWTFLTIREIESMKRRQLWEGEVPNETTTRRRANYMASKNWLDWEVPRPLDEPPLWEHLSLQIKDTNPWKGVDVVEMQSAYRLVMSDGAKKK